MDDCRGMFLFIITFNVLYHSLHTQYTFSYSFSWGSQQLVWSLLLLHERMYSHWNVQWVASLVGLWTSKHLHQIFLYLESDNLIDIQPLFSSQYSYWVEDFFWTEFFFCSDDKMIKSTMGQVYPWKLQLIWELETHKSKSSLML